ncbi:DUF6980 family protein [Xanthomonas sacchari]|uniref:DUF6980 family protein n=1 Tax=Xanthomonas sacchari TaxID=56458 RepID=UPI003D18EF46
MKSNGSRFRRPPVSYDGYTSTVLRFCPWCGKDPPSSLQSEWYKELAERGYSDPGGDDLIPEQFNSDRWWRGRTLTIHPSRPSTGYASGGRLNSSVRRLTLAWCWCRSCIHHTAG